jgi:ABC-2 type transport system permease protein
VLILAVAITVFGVPVRGSVVLLLLGIGLFIAANLAVGFTFSTFAENQLQAMRLSVFFFLPSLLLSGFMFPFRGMPEWAQVLGEAIPLTHFLRVVRGIMLKGSGFAEISHNLWPLALILVAVAAIALKRYQRTLD